MALDFRNSCLKNFNELLIYNLRQRNCNINMVKKLLAHKVDVNYKDCFLNTSLHYVVQNCSDKLDVIREILNMEGNPNAVNAEGNSPLHLAVLKSNVHVVLELLKFGGDVRLANKRGNTPLHVAAMRGKSCIIEILLKSDASLINFGNIRENTPLHIAVIHGKPYAAEMLIRNEANVNCSNIEGNTPLHMTIIHDKEDLVKSLILSGADLNCGNKDGNTPLHLSVTCGKLNLVQNLLNLGANVECTNAEGCTPLQLAVALCKFDVIKVLIEFNANVNCHTNDYISPIHTAVINGNCKLIRKLSDNGAFVNCTDLKGNTPLHLAVIHNQPNAIESLIVNGAEHIPNKNGNTPLHLAVIDGKLNLVKILLDYGADIDCRDTELNTPLHLAAIHDKPCIVIKLIDSGAKTDLVNQNSHTPVQVAALHGNVNIINVLFQNGVRVKLRNQGRRYISSFAQSLIQHSNPSAEAATGGISQPGTAGGATGLTNSPSLNNIVTNTNSLLSDAQSLAQFFSDSPHTIPANPFSLLPTSPSPSAESMQSTVLQNIISATNPFPDQQVFTAGASSQSTSNASVSLAGNASSQTVGSTVPPTQGSNLSTVTPIPNNLVPVVAQTISQLTNSISAIGGLLPLPTPPPIVNSTTPVTTEIDQDFYMESTLPTLSDFSTLAALHENAGGLLQSGACNNAPQNNYATFLDELATEGDPMSWSWSPFLRNSRLEETTVIDNLVKFYGIHGRNRSGNKFLERALASDNPTEICSLLQSSTGQSSTSRRPSRRENSFLHFATVYGKPKLVKALIESGAAIDSKNNEMNTPLHFAAFCGEAEVIDILVQSGANVDLMNRRGATALKYAFGYCKESVLKSLGKVGARRFLLAAKTLVKYDILKKGLYLTRHKVLKANCVFELLSFAEDCCSEVLCMKQKHLGKNFSFYQFVNQALSNSQPLSQNSYVEAAVEYLIEISTNTKYPIYYEILVFLIVTKLEKSFWQKKMLGLVDNAIEKGKICLNRRLFSSICNYISNVDIFNLFLAFTDAKFEKQ